MSNQGEDVPLHRVQQMYETFFRAFVENGEIEIGDRSPEQIFEQFYSLIDEFIASEGAGLRTAVDYRETVLDRARAEAGEAHYYLAATLYAIWAEHSINGLLLRAFERKGHSAEVSTPLLRELRLSTKASALWGIAGLPTIPSDSLRLLDRIIQYRNSFVHYKWILYEELADMQLSEELRDIVAQAESLVSDLLAAESSAFWSGRDRELIGRLSEDIRQAREEGR